MNELPPSALDVGAYPSGPNGMARLCEERLAELEAPRKACRNAAERSPINKRIHVTRSMLAWAKSRAGYVQE